MFLGSTFSASPQAVSNTSAPESSLSTITISNVVLDEIYATKNILVKFDWNIPDEWDWDTSLHAEYQGNTYAGNIGYSYKSIQSVKIKKRYSGEFDWKTIYLKEVNSADDLSVELYDYLEPSRKRIEYAYVIVVGGSDIDITSADLYSEFQSYFICDYDNCYPIILNPENNITYNRETQSIVSPGRKYPYVVHNGIAQYYSGTMTATFINVDDSCKLDLKNGWAYRNQIDGFLTNGKAKILKSFEGDIWMINTTGGVQRTINGHYQNVSQEFEWAECGDPNSISDLYDNGFINTDVDRE